MRNSVIAASIGLALSLAPGIARSKSAPQQDPQVAGSQLIKSVPEPNDAEIRKIRDANEWRNPYIMVERDRYELILHGQPRTETRLSLNELEKQLLEMPVRAWPLGRVVAAQEMAIRSGDDDTKIARNVKALRRMLASHKIRVQLWPTA